MINLIGIGLYSIAEAAAISGIPATKIRRWLFGYDSGHNNELHHHPSLWKTQVSEHKIEGLGFHDLLEIRFVDAFRNYGVSLQTIRVAAQHARQFFQSDYPFTCKQFQTDGRSIFAETFEETGDQDLIDLVKKQYVFKQVIRPSLYKGIQYDADGDVLRWFPLGHKNKKVVLDPQRAFGKPIVSEYGIPTDVLYHAYLAEDDIKFISTLYEVPIDAIKAAIQFEERIASGAVFFIDNNLPQPLAEALHALSVPKDHSVIHLRQRFNAPTPDIEWIQTLSSENNWVVISQDHLRKGDLEKEAFRQSGLIAFFLTRQWSNHQYWEKAHQLVRWWPAIIDQSMLITGGAAFKVPWKFSGNGKFEQVRI